VAEFGSLSAGRLQAVCLEVGMLSAFNRRQIQDCLVVLDTLAAAGITDPAAVRHELGKQFTEDRQAAASQGAGTRAKTSRSRTAVTTCPVCGGKATVKQVNTCRATIVGGNWRSAICCMNPDCLHTELSTMQPWEIN